MSPSSSQPGGGEPSGRGLREIAEILTTPARSGLVLTKARIGGLARELELPVGLGDRTQMLMGLFRAAGDAGRVAEVIGAVRGEVERWEGRYVQWGEEYPASAGIWGEWRGRLAGTREMLAEMADAVEHATAAQPSGSEPLPEPLPEQDEYAD